MTTSVGTTTAGVALNVTVTALDSSNNTVSGYGGTIHLSSTDGQAVLPADYTFTPIDAVRIPSASRSRPPAYRR